MTLGRAQLQAQGKRLLNAQGKAAIGDICCCGGTIYALTPCGTTCYRCQGCCYSEDSVLRLQIADFVDGTGHFLLTEADANAFDSLFASAIDINLTLVPELSSSYPVWQETSGGFLFQIECYSDADPLFTTIKNLATGKVLGVSWYGGSVTCGAASVESGLIDSETTPDAYNSGSASISTVYNNCEVDGVGCTAINGSRCPGGGVIYTNTDLSAYVGKTIEISDPADVCYTVSVAGSTSDGAVTPVKWFLSCGACCADLDGTAI